MTNLFFDTYHVVNVSQGAYMAAMGSIPVDLVGPFYTKLPCVGLCMTGRTWPAASER